MAEKYAVIERDLDDYGGESKKVIAVFDDKEAADQRAIELQEQISPEDYAREIGGVSYYTVSVKLGETTVRTVIETVLVDEKGNKYTTVNHPRGIADTIPLTSELSNVEYANSKINALIEVAKRNREILHGIELREAAQVRVESIVPETLTEDQIEKLYKNMDKTGYGSLEDSTLAESDMLDAAVVPEGGRLPIKVRSELGLILSERHGPIVLSGTEHRQLDKEEQDLLGIEGTEYDGFCAIMRQHKGYQPLDEPVSIPFGYRLEVNESKNEKGEYEYSYDVVIDNTLTDQAQQIGWINGQPVCALKVARTKYTDKGEKDELLRGKYFQPTAGEMAILSAQMLDIAGYKVDKVATVTGGLYAATRSLEVARANERLAAQGNPLKVGMAAYGRNRAGEITGTEPARPSVKQLVSEVSRLEALLQKVS